MDSLIHIPEIGRRQLDIMRNPTTPQLTAPLDSRFPNQNQTKYCYQMFLDYHRCVKKRGESYEPCNYFQKNYKALCPSFWYEKWEEQVEAGTFAGRI